MKSGPSPSHHTSVCLSACLSACLLACLVNIPVRVYIMIVFQHRRGDVSTPYSSKSVPVSVGSCVSCNTYTHVTKTGKLFCNRANHSEVNNAVYPVNRLELSPKVLSTDSTLGPLQFLIFTTRVAKLLRNVWSKIFRNHDWFSFILTDHMKGTGQSGRYCCCLTAPEFLV